MVLPAAPREALPTATVTFEHWSLDGADEPDLVAAESVCRAASVAYAATLSRPDEVRSAAECDESVLRARLDAPDEWSDIGVLPELGDLLPLHTGVHRDETSLHAPRAVVGEAVERSLGRRGWCPDGTAWAISGHLWYRSGSVLGWHTNTRVPGWRAYLTWVPEPGRSFFRYRDPADGRVVTSWDTGLDLRLFHVSATEAFWHCVWAGTDRHSFGYRLVETDQG